MIIQGVTLTGVNVNDLGLVTAGLTLNLDAGDSASYPGSGTTWTDLAGTADNITLVNTPTYTSGTPAYFTFNGSTQYGTGSGTNVLPTTAYTKSVWFHINAYADNNIVSSGAGGHFMFMAGAAYTKLYCGHANWNTLGGTYLDYPSTATINLNTWYYAVLTFNTTDGMVLYLNGTQDSTYTARKNAHAGNGSTNLACFNPGGNLLNGRIAQVHCYNRALTAAEVTQNFNTYKARYGL